MGEGNGSTENVAERDVASLLGWLYAICFMVAIHCQVFSTWRWRSSSGLSFDWIQFSLFGYVCLSIVATGYVFSANLQDDFHAAHPALLLPVRLSDVVLGLHGVVMSVVLIFQHFLYQREMSTEHSILGRVVMIGLWLTLVILIILEVLPASPVDIQQFLLATQILFVLSIAFRYPPQIALIFRLRSTRGWSMGVVYFQVAGVAILCIQIAFEAVAVHAWELYPASLCQLSIIGFILFYSVLLLTQKHTSCTDPLEMKQSRWELVQEQTLLSNRICYEDEEEQHGGSKIDAHQIFDDYDPSLSGRVNSTSSGMLYFSRRDPATPKRSHPLLVGDDRAAVSSADESDWSL